MNIMVIGAGGREHAIIKKLRENPLAQTLYALPGNGGIAEDAVCVPIAATDLDAAEAFAAAHKIDFAVVAPDDPLALGMVDRLESIGVPCFGPTKAAAEIESSKLFAKSLMRKYGIPTARYEGFSDEAAALDYVRSHSFPTVIKADGLALGKGVYIAETLAEAETALRELMHDHKFGKSGARVLIEEYLTGPEVSVLCFTDGTTVKPMTSAMDHKRVGDGGVGPNTGGMGAIAPNPCYTEALAAQCMETIFVPTVNAMRAEGRPFQGCLYFGLMLTADGPKVIEYNCRFGDPETQAVLPLLESDLLEIMMAVRNGQLAETPVRFSKQHACCVVLASGGYPGSYEKGKPITIGETDAAIFHAGTKKTDAGYVTNGGRVLGVTAVRPTLRAAQDAAYAAVECISFPGAIYRHDIGGAR